MSIIHPDPMPLRVDESGTIRVANTRITLDVLLGYLLNGVAPDQIVSDEWYPMLTLGDVYGILAYYHRHKAEVDEYLRDRRAAAEAAQQAIESQQPTFADVKSRLLAPRNGDHAPPAQ
jgi:uncharacterized protein (DUF433 family)